MRYTSGSHTVFQHRYPIVWIAKDRSKVVEGALRERIRTGVQIVSGMLARELVHMLMEIPPHIAVSDFVRRVKGRSSHRVQMAFPELRKRTWWACLGAGLILHHERQHHRRCHTSASSGARTYRRQSVVLQFH